MANAKQQRAALHGRGNARMQARPLTPREMAELRCRSVPRPGDGRRRAGIEELRRALNDRFGAYKCEEVAHG
jgi:hypothetical protein